MSKNSSKPASKTGEVGCFHLLSFGNVASYKKKMSDNGWKIGCKPLRVGAVADQLARGSGQ